jgi:hypothetical protein
MVSVSAAQDDSSWQEYTLVTVERGNSPEQEDLHASTQSEDAFKQEEDFSPVQEVNDMISSLSEYVKRIHSVDHESPCVADFLSCAFLALLEHGTILCRQEHFNAVKNAIQPLLDPSRFEERYILRPPANKKKRIFLPKSIKQLPFKKRV